MFWLKAYRLLLCSCNLINRIKKENSQNQQSCQLYELHVEDGETEGWRGFMVKKEFSFFLNTTSLECQLFIFYEVLFTKNCGIDTFLAGLI